MTHEETDDIIINFTVGDSNRIARIETKVGMLMWLMGGIAGLFAVGLGYMVMHG